MNRISIIIMMYQCINWIRILLEILVTLSIAITACSVLHNLCNIIACTSRFESDISFSASLRIQIDLWLPGRLGKTQFEIFSADFIVDTHGGRRENPPLSTWLSWAIFDQLAVLMGTRYMDCLWNCPTLMQTWYKPAAFYILYYASCIN